jgi:uncharacterized protein YneF (UPF0154 family)
MTFFIIICIVCGLIYGAFFEKPLADKKVKEYERKQNERMGRTNGKCN